MAETRSGDNITRNLFPAFMAGTHTQKSRLILYVTIRIKTLSGAACHGNVLQSTQILILSRKLG
jgi:hypothetical protein